MKGKTAAELNMFLRLTPTPLTLDPQVRNIASFINFRCDPNLESRPLRTQGEDPNFMRLGFFAKTNINTCDELGYLRDPDANQRSKYSDVPCDCGASARGGKCRGKL